MLVQVIKVLQCIQEMRTFSISCQALWKYLFYELQQSFSLILIILTVILLLLIIDLLFFPSEDMRLKWDGP